MLRKSLATMDQQNDVPFVTKMLTINQFNYYSLNLFSNIMECLYKYMLKYLRIDQNDSHDSKGCLSIQKMT